MVLTHHPHKSESDSDWRVAAVVGVLPCVRRPAQCDALCAFSLPARARVLVVSANVKYGSQAAMDMFAALLCFKM
jgi:hypothetical protein